MRTILGENSDLSLSDYFLQEFSKFKERNPDRDKIRILLFTHRQADPDALCSGAGLSLVLQKLAGNLQVESKIVVPQGASTLGSSVSRSLEIDFTVELDEKVIRNADFIVTLDVGEPELLEPFLAPILSSLCPKVMIDHHGTTMQSLTEAISQGKSSDEKPISSSRSASLLAFDSVIADRNATSTCEIVTNGFPPQYFDKHISEILLVGLLFDSQHLGLATASTLEAALRLVRAGAQIEDAKNRLRVRPDKSEIIARIKSAQRLRYLEVGKYLVLMSEVSSFQASVARMLVDLGGDVGIAYGETEKETRISVRSTQRFFRESGIDLGAMLSELAASKRGTSPSEEQISGGGHGTAASFSSKGIQPAKPVEELLNLLRAKLLHSW